MKIRFYFYLSLFLLFGQFLLAQNGTILLENPSFEGVPAEGTMKGTMPDGWYDCGFLGETVADVHPKAGGGQFQVSKLPKDGKTYFGLVVRENNTWESVGQQFSAPLQAGKTYDFSVFLCRSLSYVSASRVSATQVNFAMPAILRIWGGRERCDKQEMLAASEPIVNSTWQEYRFNLSPSQNFTHLVFEAFYKTPTPSPYNGNLLMDAASNIVVAAKTDEPLNEKSRQEFSKPLMGTDFRIITYFADSAIVKNAVEAAFERVAAIEKVFSDYDETSEVSQLSEKGNAVVSKELWDMLNYCVEVSKQSKGAFDVSIGGLTKLWRKAFRNKEMPTKDEIKAAKASIGYEGIGFNIPAQKIWLKKPGMKLDFGAVAKGYAVDEAMAVLRNFGIYVALVDGGGDLLTGWAPPGQLGWEIEQPGKIVNGELTFKKAYYTSTAIATSGDTYRYLEHEGKHYSHIINPRTGYGLTNRRAVTVTALTCISADAWATAASVEIERSLMKKLENEGIEFNIVEE